MNKHIELVKRYLADKDSVSQEELRANADAAWETAAYVASDAAYAAAYVASDASDAADAAYAAARTAADAAARTAYYVKRYEKLTDE